jgi:hypothetical protein
VKSKAAKKTPERRHRLRSDRLAEPQTDACSKAGVILARTHDSADALLNAFELSQQQRGSPRGNSTDDEQDLLRAMLRHGRSGTRLHVEAADPGHHVRPCSGEPRG